MSKSELQVKVKLDAPFAPSASRELPIVRLSFSLSLLLSGRRRRLTALRQLPTLSTGIADL